MVRLQSFICVSKCSTYYLLDLAGMEVNTGAEAGHSVGEKIRAELLLNKKESEKLWGKVARVVEISHVRGNLGREVSILVL